MRMKISIVSVFCLCVIAGLAPKVPAQNPATTSARAQSVQLTQLIDRHIQAIGGQEILSRIKTAQLSFAGQSGPRLFNLIVSYRADGKLAMEIWGRQGMEVRQVRDEHGNWWRVDVQSSRKLKDPKDSLDLWAFTVAMEPIVWLRLNETFVDFRVDGREQLNGKEVNSFRAATPQGGIAKFYFDAATAVLIGVNNTRFEDYKDFFGVRFPEIIRQGPQILKLERIAYNPPLNDALFEPPPEVSSLVRKAQASNILYQDRQMESNHLGIVRVPPPMPMMPLTLLEWPQFASNVARAALKDLGGMNLSAVDLSQHLNDLWGASFDRKTTWPKRLPAAFNPQTIINNGQNPGLGVRRLQARNITGKDVGIALIDQTLLVDHMEYKERLKLYEEHVRVDSPATRQGCAMASIAVGKTCGVAPGADLYYWAGTYTYSKAGWVSDADLDWIASAIERVLEVNRSLPKASRIRVIGISAGWNPKSKSPEACQTAVKRAEAAGILLLANGLEDASSISFLGLGRNPATDPDLLSSYTLGRAWQKSDIEGKLSLEPRRRLLVPADSRTMASCAGTNDYVYFAEGNPASPIAYLAGLYALACEVKPSLSPEEFKAVAFQTGNAIQADRGRGKPELGTVVNPEALLEVLTKAESH
jgi:hypothetical protein